MYRPGIDQSKSEQLHQHILLPAPTVIGADGVATDFGNTPNGILREPDEAVVDLSLSKSQKIALAERRRQRAVPG